MCRVWSCPHTGVGPAVTMACAAALRQAQYSPYGTTTMFSKTSPFQHFSFSKTQQENIKISRLEAKPKESKKAACRYPQTGLPGILPSNGNDL